MSHGLCPLRPELLPGRQVRLEITARQPIVLSGGIEGHGVEPGSFKTTRRDWRSPLDPGFVRTRPEDRVSKPGFGDCSMRRRDGGRAVVKFGNRHYICRRRSALLDRSNIPRGLIDPKGAVPGRTRGFGHTAPTYIVGTRDRPLHRTSRIATFCKCIFRNPLRRICPAMSLSRLRSHPSRLICRA